MLYIGVRAATPGFLAFESKNEVSPLLRNPRCDKVGGTCGERSNDECLDSAPHGRSTGVASLDVAEDE